MEGFFNAIRRLTADFLGKRSKKQKILMGATAAVLVTAVIVSSVLLGRENYSVLYTGLDGAEAGKILAVLEEKNIDAKAGGTGIILVPSDSADEVRMELAAEGYPESGLNYDIFTNASSFGKTDQEMKTYQQYQLQENLRRAIMTFDTIEDCVVMVNIPSDSLFVLSSDEQEAGASVVLQIKNGETLTSGEAKAIAELVSKSVPDLSAENVRIMDTKMNLYDAAGDDDEQYNGSQYELTESVRSTYAEQVLSILTPVFGEDNVSAAVNVELNFDSETVNKVQYSPPVEGDDSGIIVSMEELYNRTQGDGTAEGAAGTDSNGVGTPEYPYANADTGDFSKISRSVNYELNETQTQIEKARGRIEGMSVAVLLNSDEYGDDYEESVRELVARAIGADESMISVVSLPFQTSGEDESMAGIFDEQASLMDKLNMKDVVMAIITAITILVILLFVFRFMKYAFDNSGRKRAAATPDGSSISLPPDGQMVVRDKAREDITELKKSSGTEEIERFVDKDPAAVARLLRNWLTDEDD